MGCRATSSSTVLFFSASLLGVKINHAADGGLRSIDNPYFFVRYHGNAAVQMMMMMIMCVLGWVTHVDVETPSRMGRALI